MGEGYQHHHHHPRHQAGEVHVEYDGTKAVFHSEVSLFGVNLDGVNTVPAGISKRCKNDGHAPFFRRPGEALLSIAQRRKRRLSNH